jgi:hypothetical protein
MHSLGGMHLLVLLVFVVLVLDSRRVRALVGSAGRDRRDSGSGQGMPAGVDGDRVGLPLGQIQMRIHVDWEDGGIGWEGPEILPVDEPPAEADAAAGAEPNPALPVLWKPFPAFLLSEWYAREDSTLHPPGKEPGALVELRAHDESTRAAQWPTVVPSARTA